MPKDATNAGATCQIKSSPTVSEANRRLSPFTSTWNNGADWRMTGVVSDQEGLVLTDIVVGNRYMAKEFSVPYYYVSTSQVPRTRHTLGWSNFIGETVKQNYNAYIIEAHFKDVSTCLEIIQQYSFTVPNNSNEPSQFGLPALKHNPPLISSKYTPEITYHFYSKNGEIFNSINTAQRLHFWDGGVRSNIGTFLVDNNNFYSSGMHTGIIGAGRQMTQEAMYQVIKNGSTAPIDASSPHNNIDLGTGKMFSDNFAQPQFVPDNWHQTYKDHVQLPSSYPVGPGCPECVHIHWRWSKSAPSVYGDGKPLIPQGSNQDVSVGVAKFHSGEETPHDWEDLFSPSENLPASGTEIVFWYSATGYQSDDTFFEHGGFYAAMPFMKM